MSEIMENTAATDATDQTPNQEAATKTYTQEEFDNHMAGLKNSITKKFEKQLSELGDIEELKAIKANAEKAKQEEAIKRGEFETILQDMAAKHNSQLEEKNRIIEEYTVNTPLLNAAAQHKAVNPQQVVQLIRNQVRLGDSGNAEVIDQSGTPRYDSNGKAVTVETLVQEFLQSNPHFVAATPSTTNTKSSVGTAPSLDGFDLNSLDLTKQRDREIYKQARQKGLV